MKKLKSIVLTATLLFVVIQTLQAQEIFNAVKSGNLQEVKRLISANHSLVDSLDDRGNTPLINAIREGNIEMTRDLIAEGSNVNHKNKSGYTPLHFASDKNQIEVVNLLLEKGAEINAVNKYQITPLFSAIEKKNVDIAAILLKRGADVNFSSPVFGCPVHRVAYVDSPDLLKLILANKADIEAKDSDGKTALHLAGMLGRPEVTKILLENGADVNAIDNGGISPLHHAIMYGKDRDGINRSSELVNYLVSKGANVNTVTNDGHTPILSATIKGYTDVVKVIHNKGGDIYWMDKVNSQTLLHTACIKGYGDLVDYLTDQGVNKNLKDKFGKTAGDYALQFGHEKIAKKLFGNKKILNKSEIGHKYINATISGKEAFIWSLNNRGWAIKTADHFLVFDNEENGRKPDQPSVANGWISTKEICNENVTALYSAYHAIPNSLEFIHSIEDSLKNIVYLHYKDDRWRGGKNSYYLKGREIQKFGTAEIISYETHDSYGMGSLGYLVKANDLTFFYPNFFPEDTIMFKKEIDFLSEQCNHCDFAIIDFTPGSDYIYTSYIIQKLKPKMIIPYNRSNDFKSYEEFKIEMAKKYPSIKIQYAELPGVRIFYKKD